MKVLVDLIETCEDVKVREVFVGYFDTAVLSRRCGIATTMKIFCGVRHERIKNAGKFKGMRANELAKFLLSEKILEASIGMAALNSAIPEIAEEKLTDVNAAEILEDKGRGKTVAVIGNFPFVGKLKKSAKKLFVFDTNPQEGVFPAEEEYRLLPEADVVAITGTSLINHTFENIISNIKKDAYKIMLGPSVPLSPVLFDYGIDAVSGTIVEDESLLLTYLRQAASFKELPGKRLVTVFKNR
ncbi:MAG: DUF364 domain-containing protein [Elusimicrobia bacterium]|nr:DUF364 domain-containing protein [Elusimicrobiota bacterium]